MNVKSIVGSSPSEVDMAIPNNNVVDNISSSQYTAKLSEHPVTLMEDEDQKIKAEEELGCS